MASKDQPSTQPKTEDENGQQPTEQFDLTIEDFEIVPFDKLLGIGSLIFISHKLEELFQEVLADVIIWCPDYLRYIAEKYKFWMEGINKYHFVDLKQAQHSSSVVILDLISDLSLDDQWWSQSIADKHLAYRTYQNLWDRTRCSKSLPDGINWIKRAKINQVLDRFNITLGQLCKEILQCQTDLTKTGGSQVRFKDVVSKQSSRTWLSAINTVNSQLNDLDRAVGEDAETAPLLFIADLKNDTTHHGWKRPCLFSGDGRDERMQKMKTFYKTIIESEGLLDLIEADDVKVWNIWLH